MFQVSRSTEKHANLIHRLVTGASWTIPLPSSDLLAVYSICINHIPHTRSTSWYNPSFPFSPSRLRDLEHPPFWGFRGTMEDVGSNLNKAIPLSLVFSICALVKGTGSKPTATIPVFCLVILMCDTAEDTGSNLAATRLCIQFCTIAMLLTPYHLGSEANLLILQASAGK